jgi:hypothetical protein
VRRAIESVGTREEYRIGGSVHEHLYLATASEAGGGYRLTSTDWRKSERYCYGGHGF